MTDLSSSASERLKVLANRFIPPSLLYRTLLAFPRLYHTRLVNFETTLADNHGIDELLDQLDHTLARRLPGDVIECGSARGGASAIMALHLRRKGIAKTIYACDTYGGFDPAELAHERRQGLTTAPRRSFTGTSAGYVRAKMRALGLGGQVIPVKGLFQETLPKLARPYCFALIDCDLRESTVYAAETVWTTLVPQGRIVFDDYRSADYRGARLGVDQFVQRHAGEIAAHGLLNRLYFVCKA